MGDQWKQSPRWRNETISNEKCDDIFFEINKITIAIINRIAHCCGLTNIFNKCKLPNARREKNVATFFQCFTTTFHVNFRKENVERQITTNLINKLNVFEREWAGNRRNRKGVCTLLCCVFVSVCHSYCSRKSGKKNSNAI